MAVAYVTGGVSGNNTSTSFTIVIPTVSANDILVLDCVNGSAQADPTVSDNEAGSTWVKKYFINFATASRGFTYWRRATASTSAKTITASGFTNSCAGVLTVYSGCVTSGDPFDQSIQEANASGNEVMAGFIPSVTGTMVCLAVLCNDNLAVGSQACTDPGALTERQEKSNAGGTDTNASHASLIKNNVNATGNFTWTQTDFTTGSICYNLKPPSSTAWEKSLSDTLTLGDSLGKGVGQTQVDSFILVDSLGKAPQTNKADIFILVDSFSRAVEFLRSYPDSVSISDSLSKASGITKSDLLTIADILLAERGLVKGLADNVSLGDFLSFAIALNKVDTLSLADSISKQVDFAKVLIDSVSLADSLNKLAGLAESDSIILADNLSKGLSLIESDSVILADILGKESNLIKVDNVALADSLNKLSSLIKTDNIAITESAVKAIILNKVESVIIADSLAKAIGAVKSDLLAIIDDIQTQLESGVVGVNWTKTLEDLIHIVDSLEKINTDVGFNFPKEAIRGGPPLKIGGRPFSRGSPSPRNTGYIMGGR